MVKKLKKQGEASSEKRTRLFFLVVIILYTLLLYGNTLRNTFSFEDIIIFGNDNQLIEEGVSAIGDIFTTPYTFYNKTEGVNISYGYRPIARLSFAIEYSIMNMFGEDPKSNPWVGHLISMLFYLALVLVLYHVLRRMFKGNSIWFPFLITMLFIAHPIHTEVVASIKNRDELLSMLFSLLTLHYLFKYYDKEKVICLVFGLLMYALAFLSKPTSIAFLFVFPLTMYFFTKMSWKKIGSIFGLLTLVFILAGIMPMMLFDSVRDVSMVDNPLYFEDNFWNVLGTSFYSLGYYFRLLVVPFPLLYYYGYNMIPVVNLANVWVILSILFHIGLLGVAIWKIREKSILSYAILFYLLSIAFFSNLIQPLAGVIAEKYLLVPSIGFVMMLVWVFFKLFKANPDSAVNKSSSMFFVVVLTALVLIPYTVLTVDRNKEWYSESMLYNTDMKYLENSVKAHHLVGNRIMRTVDHELAKPVNVAKFMMPQVHRSLAHFHRATEIWPGHVSSWRYLGMIYNHPRIAEHLLAQGDTANFISFKKNAISSFSKAIELSPSDEKALLNLGLTYEYFGNADSADYYYESCIEHNPVTIEARSRLANLKFIQGDTKKAFDLNLEIVSIDPMESIPYVSFGNYYLILGDTLKAIESFEEAATRDPRPEVFAFLGQYYLNNGDMQKTQFYREKYEKAIKP